MKEIDSTAINSFVSHIQSPVSPSESVTVPIQALQDLIGAIHSLKDEVASLQDGIAQARQEMAALTARVASLESLQEQDVTSPRTGKESRSWKGHQSHSPCRKTGPRSSGLYLLRTVGRCSRRTPGKRCILVRPHSLSS